jgi:cytochrome c553
VKWSVIAISVFGLMASLPAQAAGDAKSGRQKALQCQACHGLDGLSKLPEAPNLAGQVEVYLAKALHDFKSGARQNEMMTAVSQTLSDEDIDNLAAYYARLGTQ